jgi:hypothetical protein
MPSRKANGNVLRLSSGSPRRARPRAPRARVTTARFRRRRPSLKATYRCRVTVASHRRAVSRSSGRSNTRQVPKGMKPRPPNTMLWISLLTSLDAGRAAEPNRASQRTASSSVMVPESPRRMSALVRMAVVVRFG